MPKGISDKFEAPADASGQIIAGNQSLLKRDTEPSGSCSIHFHSSSCIIWHAGAGVPIRIPILIAIHPPERPQFLRLPDTKSPTQKLFTIVQEKKQKKLPKFSE